ncbi:hypothetical protein NQ314_006703 [Rhamnusium bicolor]|uniref:C2H2-type domain-containing protein n=1 Tax=Rhamnusium bicolor TaxID=1586634 RepID=A0AAV8YZE5_9CUCU|nr:hypothetical protein NQ314_006703 [Rhamnusium bicolor]
MSFTSVYQCDICLKNNSVGLISLVNHEKVLALKLIKSRKNYILLLREPPYACTSCFKKLFVLRVYIQRILKSRKLNGKMQQPSVPISKENEEEKSETPKEEEQCVNDYTCQCTNCQNKYGSLPLLLQVIEQESREKTESSAVLEPQPSTSSSQDTDYKAPKKSLVCQYCNKSFSHKGDYNKHLRKHTKEQPFTCPVCKRKFAHTSNLQRHYRLHSGHRPFVCENCNKRFSRKDKLECHMKSKFCKSTNVPKK